MLVAAPYTNDSRWKDIPDEYNITYNENSTTEKLVDFCKQIKKRINVYFQDIDVDKKSILLAHKENNLLHVRLNSTQMPEKNWLKENNIPFFFDDTLPCYSFGILKTLIDFGVSDVYIYDDLCYNMAIVKEICEEAGVQIRMVLNRIASLNPEAGTDIRAPFFMPKDMKQLQKYIDVVEFSCGTPHNWHRFNVYYKAFIVKQDWFGDLRELNMDLQVRLPHYSTLPYFSNRKMNCDRDCYRTSSCNHCDLLLDVANILDEEGYYVKENQGNKQ